MSGECPIRTAGPRTYDWLCGRSPDSQIGSSVLCQQLGNPQGILQQHLNDVTEIVSRDRKMSSGIIPAYAL